jgi:hypothetical protein
MYKLITVVGLFLLAVPVAVAENGSVQNLEDLMSLGQSSLDAMYASTQPGPVPDGDSEGRAIMFPGTILEAPASLAAALIWQGKVFDVTPGSTQGTLINKVFGFRAINADVFVGPSWFDGKPAIIIDYKDTSLLVPFVRDEIREVAPGIYLGRVYIRTLVGDFLGLNFALDFNS